MGFWNNVDEQRKFNDNLDNYNRQSYRYGRKDDMFNAVDTAFHGLIGSLLYIVFMFSTFGFRVIGLGIADVYKRLVYLDIPKFSQLHKVLKNLIVFLVMFGLFVFSIYVFMKTYIFLLVYLLVVMVFGIKFMWFRHGIKNNFKAIRFIDTYKNVPKMLDYKNKKAGIKEFTFKSIIPYYEWDKAREDLSYIFNSPIMDMYYPGNYITVIVFAPQWVIDELNKPKEIVNHKDESIEINERVKAVFDFMEIPVQIKAVKDGKFGSVVYFNSVEEYNRIQSSITEIRHRLKINNVVIETSDINKFDYVLKIIKNVEKISFLESYNEVKDKLNNINLPVILGLNTQGELKLVDYIIRYNTLIGGTIRSGKTNEMKNILLLSLLAKKNISYIIIDPKNDMGMFKGIDNVYHTDCEDITKTIKLLILLVKEMERRNKLFATYEFCDNIERYNQITGKNMPYVYVVVEELADLILIANKDYRDIIENQIQRLAQRSPSAGIKLFLSTQKPTKDVVGKFTKANCPNKMAFQVSEAIESRVILDNSDAVNIKDKGVFIFKDGNNQDYFKAPYLDDLEYQKVIKIIKSFNKPIYKVSE